MNTVIDASVMISAPAEVVFDFVQDAAQRPRWDERVLRAHVSDAPAPAKGAHLVIDMRAFGPVKFTIELEYTLFERPLRTAVRIVAVKGPTLLMGGGGSWTYEPVGNDALEPRTRFTTRFTYDVKGGALGRLMNRLWLRPFLLRLTVQSLANLKRLLE